MPRCGFCYARQACRSDELFVKLTGNAIDGAFTPPDWVPNPPD